MAEGDVPSGVDGEQSVVNRPMFIFGSVLFIIFVAAFVAVATGAINLVGSKRTGALLGSGLIAYFAIALLVIANDKLRKFLIDPVRRTFELVEIIVGVDGKSRLQPPWQDDLERLIEELRARKDGQPAPLSADSEQAIVDAYTASLDSRVHAAINGIFREAVRKEYAADIRGYGVEKLSEAEQSLRKASATVTTRGFLNLIIGIGFAIAAFFFLRDSVTAIENTSLTAITIEVALVFIGIRLSLTLLLTLIAYFFLTLYRASLEDVRYFQNEITNLSCKSSALALAIGANKEELLLQIGSHLVSDDRNAAQAVSEKAVVSDNEVLKEILKRLPMVKVT